MHATFLYYFLFPSPIITAIRISDLFNTTHFVRDHWIRLVGIYLSCFWIQFFQATVPSASPYFSFMILQCIKKKVFVIFDLDQFTRSPDFAFILFGKWQTKPDSYNSYHALYALDKKNIDDETIKRIPSDKVQTIILHVEGSPDYTGKFLQSLDIKKLNSLVD